MELQKAGFFGGADQYRLLFKFGPEVHAVDFPAEYFRSPQFYKQDQHHFAVKPRELQLNAAGAGFYPVPMRLTPLTEEQIEFADHLMSSIWVGKYFVTPAEFSQLVRQATETNAVGGSSSSRPPKKEESSTLFRADTKTNPDEVLKNFDHLVRRASKKHF